MTKEEKLQRAQEGHDLTHGPITKKILLFALPIMAGNLFQQLYNVVDSWVVGNFAANGTGCLAAVNVSFPIMMLFNSLFMGVSMGANIIISQYKGAKDHENLDKAMTTTFALSMLIGLFITVAGLILAEPILVGLGTPADILNEATTYLRIIFIGTCGNIIYNGLNGMLRGLGDAKFPMYALIGAALLNIVLDMLFVIVFHWDVAGVAWATIISHFASGIFLVIRQNTGCYGARINFKKLKMDKSICLLIVKLGLPAAIQNMAFSGGMVIMQTFANRFGTTYIAAHAVITKADGFAMMPMMGLQMAITTYVGQNIGAGDIKRTNKGIRSAALMGLGIAVVVGVLIYAFGPNLMEAFNVDEVTLAKGVRGLRFLCFFYVFIALQNVFGGSLRGAGASTASAITSVVSTLIRIPLGYVLAIVPLERACNEAVAAGLYETAKLAELAGIGSEHYIGMFRTTGLGMAIGLLLILPYFIWGNWRNKGITSKAKAIGGGDAAPAGEE